MKSPITNIRNLKIFTNGELSNDDYHGEEYADHTSGSDLHCINDQCPAVWKFAEKKESAALHFGIASHASMLEPKLFDEQFVRGLCIDDYPTALTSDASMKSWLKERGVKGYSNKKKPELIAMIKMTGEPALIWPEMLEKHEEMNAGKTIVPFDDYDKIMQMRRVVFADDEYAEMLTDSYFETSVICEIEIDGEWHKVKIRPDIITKDFMVPDYKTTAYIKPEDFGAQAVRQGYWLKMAFVHDVLAAAYGQKPKVGFLAQSKSDPFIPQDYWMDEQQIQVGREQYTMALRYLAECKKNNVWPKYTSNGAALVTPGWAAKQYGMD